MLKYFFLSVALLIAPILSAKEASAVIPSASAEENIAIDLGDLLILSDPTADPTQDPKEATFCKEHFSMTAQLYCAILNTVAHGGYDDIFHLYTDHIATVMTRALDANGVNHYTVLEGQDQTVLGSLPCLDTTQLNALYNNQDDTCQINAKVATDGNSTLLIKLGETYTSPPEEGVTYADQKSFGWSEAPREDGSKADYYWLKSSTSTDSPSLLVDHQISGELWVSLPIVPPSDKATWHATRTDKAGFTTKTTITPASIPSNNSKDSAGTWSQWWSQLSPLEQSAFIVVGVLAGACMLGMFYTSAIILPIYKTYCTHLIFGSLFTSLAALLCWAGYHIASGS